MWVSADQSWYNVVNSDESGEIKISTNEINDMDSIADPTKLVCGLASCLYESHRAYHNSKTWSENWKCIAANIMAVIIGTMFQVIIINELITVMLQCIFSYLFQAGTYDLNIII